MTLRQRLLWFCALWLFAAPLLAAPPAEPSPAVHLWEQGQNAMRDGRIDEMLQDSRSKTPDTEMVETDDLKHVMILLDKMDKREATVLRMRFGLDDEEPRTLKEIGECLGLTRERVRQIESEALAKLGDNLSGE